MVGVYVQIQILYIELPSYLFPNWQNTSNFPMPFRVDILNGY